MVLTSLKSAVAYEMNNSAVPNQRDHAHSVINTQRLLIVSVSAGSGHVRAAEAIAAHARNQFTDLTVRHRDLMQLVPAYFRKIYTDLYLKLAGGLPEAWGWLYRKTDHEPTGSLTERCRRALQRLASKKFFTEIEDYQPNAIICTHFLPAELLATAALEKRLTCPVWVVVTDFDLHQMWIHAGITGYFVANEELSFRLQSSGVSEKNIVVTGIPIMPEFIHRPNRLVCAAKYGLNPHRQTLLVMGGGAGLGITSDLVKSLLALHDDLQLIIMTGKNQSLLNELQNLSLFWPDRLVAIGFTNDVPELMACADMVITKPGGLSISECLVMELPMLLINPIPGQEERNASYLLQESVAQRADDVATLIYRLRRLLANSEKLAQMKQNTTLINKPLAATTLLHHIKNYLTGHKA